MGAGAYVRAVARLYLPLMLVFALSLFMARPAGAGVGLLSALGFALALVLHCLAFGADVARAALPEPIARLLLALGAALALFGACAPNAPYAAQAAEAGLFLAGLAALTLFIAALAGRAPSLREEQW